ncbi:putative defensin-like protein 315 [Arabidopsis thaliana]
MYLSSRTGSRLLFLVKASFNTFERKVATISSTLIYFVSHKLVSSRSCSHNFRNICGYIRHNCQKCIRFCFCTFSI